ncbi:MAG: hypothetical protein IJF56_10605 [Clostridia bacterium]|nr:hypothetical protein [Clostridia bacterium]
MPSNMPDIRAVNEALRRAREMQRRSAPPPPPATSPPPPPPEPKPEPLPPPEPIRPASKGESAPALDLFLKDKERTLILALLILLSGEGNNTELLFALMYLLI